MRQAFCKNKRKTRWSPNKRKQQVRCVEKSTSTLCGDVYSAFNISSAIEANCRGKSCRFSCPEGEEPSHPKGIACKRPRVEKWSEPTDTRIECVQSDPNFNDFTEQCGRLRDHPKSSWVMNTKHLKIICGRKKKRRQECELSCSRGKNLSGASTIACSRNSTGIFLESFEERKCM